MYMLCYIIIGRNGKVEEAAAAAAMEDCGDFLARDMYV